MHELPPPLNRRVGRIAARFSGRFGIYSRDLRHQAEVVLDGNRRLPAASTIKLFVLRELFRRADAGELDLRLDSIEMRSRDLVKGSGVLRDLTPGLRLNLRDLATLMITISDNTAANILIDQLGTRAINRGMERVGYLDTHLRGLFFRSRGVRSSYTTPLDLGRFMAGLASGREISKEASRAMLAILYREHYDHIVGRRIPYQPEAPTRPRWRIASKSGSIRGVRNDVAYVVGPGCRYVVALMSEGCADVRFNDDNEGVLALAEVAREIHEWFARAR